MRRVVILAFPGLQTLDVHGPAEVFSTATSLNRGDGYAVEVVAPGPGPVPTSSVAIHADGTLAGCRRATTHWSGCAELALRHPEVEEDLGREIALEAARWLVLFVKRPGGQAQFSAQLAAQMAELETMRRAFRRRLGVSPGSYRERFRSAA